MLGTVMVPLDGSGFAEAALPLARRLAARAGARLYLATADHFSGVVAGGGDITSAFAVLSEDCLKEDELYLANTANQLGQIAGQPVMVRLLDGAPGEAICDEAGRIGADLIVMATHGRNAMTRLWLGSVADHVVANANRPVLLIKPSRLGGRAPTRPVRHILVPLAPGATSEAILEPVVTLAPLLDATITLLTVVAPQFGFAEPELPPPAPQHPAIAARRSDEAHMRLDRVAGFYRRLGIEVRTRVVLAGTPAGGILQVLSEDRFDMVAMTTIAKAGVRRLIAGSVTRRVIQGTGKPVLAYHPLYM
jgi:nucleotide-binding universal stress UspA family protein